MRNNNLSSMLQYQHSFRSNNDYALPNLSISLKMYKMLQDMIIDKMDKGKQYG
jgi:hypothetical protein